MKKQYTVHLAIALFILCTQYLCRAHAIVLNLSGATQNCTFCGFRCSQLFVRFVASMQLKVKKSESIFIRFLSHHHNIILTYLKTYVRVQPDRNLGMILLRWYENGIWFQINLSLKQSQSQISLVAQKQNLGNSEGNIYVLVCKFAIKVYVCNTQLLLLNCNETNVQNSISVGLVNQIWWKFKMLRVQLPKSMCRMECVQKNPQVKSVNAVDSIIVSTLMQACTFQIKVIFWWFWG